jgi:hypothetical protein
MACTLALSPRAARGDLKKPEVIHPPGWTPPTETRRQYDRFRGSASKRGYGHNWAKVRELHIARNPLCAACSARLVVIKTHENEAWSHLITVGASARLTRMNVPPGSFPARLVSGQQDYHRCWTDPPAGSRRPGGRPRTGRAAGAPRGGLIYPIGRDLLAGSADA